MTAIAALALTGGALLGAQASRSAYEIPRDLAFYSPSFRCPTAISDHVANYVSYAVPGERVEVGLQEQDPTTGEWHMESFVYSTSFRVLDVAFRRAGRELFVSGVHVQGPSYTDVVEKWVFPAFEGGYVATVSAGTPIGVPRGPFSGSLSIAGGSYVPPLERIPNRQPVPHRTVLYSQPSGGHFNCIVADPEGRYLLLHNYTTGDILSLDLMAPNATPQVVFTAAEHPVLAAARSMVLHDVPGIGRICRLTAEDHYGAYPSGSNQTPVLIDSDNDGVFQTFAVHSSVDIARGLTPYGQSLDWRSAVEYGWDWRTEFR